ncbi:hypothetical protein M9H77_22368 [Catharanthus roseus]|uniref:Uncharacterized protein n=1 Tax=Catharanthus roseus TaxID=4058 RepID=A0ACC0ARS4_CATRO|nr:hypothetical protein M9H77_22368 [Catharanthus roseus]
MAIFMSQKFKKDLDCYSIVISFAIILDPRYKISHVEVVLRYLDSNTTEAKEYVQFAPNQCLHKFDSGGNLNEGDTRVDDIDLFERFESKYGTTFSKSQLDFYLDEALMFIKIAMMRMKMPRMRESPLTF